MGRYSFPKDKIKILLVENVHTSGQEAFESDGFKVVRIDRGLTEKELIEQAADVHILGIRSKTHLTANVLKQTPKLLAVGCFCIGTNQVDLLEAKKRGVAVFNAPYSNTRSVAELVMAEIVFLARQTADRNTLLHQGKWNKSAKNCHEVRGKNIGIVGYGNIGSQVSILAESFGLNVYFYDIATKMPLGNSRVCNSLKDLLSVSDFVTLHVPETPQTKGMIGAAELKSMKSGACLLNLSRGSVVDIEALREAIESKQLGGCAIDVFPEEPEKNEDIFRSSLQGLPNVILTPHIGGSTEEAQFKIGQEVGASLLRYINEGSTKLSVNFPQVEQSVRDDSHRILNIHENRPGVLVEINKIISEEGANIQGQQLSTDPDIGYLIMDVDRNVSDVVKERIKKLPTSIKTRILY
ncbi:MAG: phosphoglycerate dehydrogenase [Deltaproteobacteria bacterium CG11_big_fil_rev_8_21_14_0_20_45_16]|nr:MAG: phosphoglycerate dehydrogenase [Deltaproteobacteria bacterium CG11_big_fil_rev_8_21_14_0_20_45_16]